MLVLFAHTVMQNGGRAPVVPLAWLLVTVVFWEAAEPVLAEEDVLVEAC